MASIHRETQINVPVEKVWAALADLGELHTQLVPGFVTNCVLDGGARMVTLANGLTVREQIIDVDAERRRVAWSAQGANLTHYGASAQALSRGGNTCRVVWPADLLPHVAAPAIAGMIEQGLCVMKRHLESVHAAA